VTLTDLICQHLVERATQNHDAAARYYCPRSGRTLWVEPEARPERSVHDAPRYLVDDGSGERTFYRGDDFEAACARLMTYSKYGRSRARPAASSGTSV
jgi:hypothetical protein